MSLEQDPRMRLPTYGCSKFIFQWKFQVEKGT